MPNVRRELHFPAFVFKKHKKKRSNATPDAQIKIFLKYLVSTMKIIPWWPAEALLDMVSEPSWTTNRTNQKTLNRTGTANWFHREMATARSLYSSITWEKRSQGTCRLHLIYYLWKEIIALCFLCPTNWHPRKTKSSSVDCIEKKRFAPDKYCWP